MSTLPTVQQMNQIPNTSQFTELIFGNIIMSKIGNVLNDDFKLSFPNIAKLLFLMSSTEIKNAFSVFISYVIDLIKQSPHFALCFVMKLNSFRKPKQIECSIIEKPLSDFYNKKVSIEVNSNFMNTFYNFIKEHKQCVSTKTLDGINIKNMREKIFVQKFDNIVIEYENYKLFIDDILLFGINIITNEIVYNSIGNKSKIRNLSQVKRYSDLFSKKQRKLILEYYEYIVKVIMNGTNDPIKWCQDKYGIKEITIFTEITMTILLLEKYPQFDKNTTFIEVLILSTIISAFTGKPTMTDELNTIKSSCRTLFDKNNVYNSICSSSITYATVSGIWNELHKYNQTRGHQNVEIKQIFIKFISPQPKSKEPKKNSTITICIQSDLEFNETQIMMDFMDDICKSSKRTTSKIKINLLQLDENIQKSEVVNPDYEEYIEKNKSIEQLKLTTENCPIDIITFLSNPMPKKMIITETITKKVVSNQLNEIEKDVDTLYLREDDKLKLLSSLFQFRDKKDILRDLGLQNKLNLLLYGIPGTGKSTAIQAIATYLQKDIYYVDLQKAKLNEDLQLIFDYVNKNVPDGGIIVIEDIDAMTDVVLARNKETVECKVKDLISNKDSKLSLEYLLNILQGTLTVDNSIFIVTTNHIEHLDPAFYRDGRFDVKIEFKLCDHHQIKAIYRKMIRRELPIELLDRIPENKYSPATVIFHIKNYIFNMEASDEKIMEPFLC